MVEAKTGNASQAWPEVRNTREVVAVRFSAGERWQIGQAAALKRMPFSTYVRAVAVRSAFDDVCRRSNVLESKARKPGAGVSSEHLEKTGEAAVLDIPDQPAVHYVDGEPVSWRLA